MLSHDLEDALRRAGREDKQRKCTAGIDRCCRMGARPQEHRQDRVHHTPRPDRVRAGDPETRGARAGGVRKDMQGPEGERALRRGETRGEPPGKGRGRGHSQEGPDTLRGIDPAAARCGGQGLCRNGNEVKSSRARTSGSPRSRRCSCSATRSRARSGGSCGGRGS